MRIHDDSGVEDQESGDSAVPNRRAVMLSGVAAGAAGVVAGRKGWQDLAGTRTKAGAIRKTQSKAAPDSVPGPITENDHSVTVLPYSFYGSSGDDFARINTAFSMLPTMTLDGFSYTVGRVNLGPYPYVGNTKIIMPVTAELVGQGPGTVLQPNGAPDNNPVITWHDTNGGTGGGFGSYQVAAGTIRDLLIDGSDAGASAVGISLGDGWGFKVLRVRIQKFTGGSAVGLYLNNKLFWTEKSHIQCTLWGNTTAAQVDVDGGQASFEFNDFDFDVFVFAGQNGVMFTNGAYLSKGDFRMVGNFLASSSPPATAALTLTGSATIGSSTFFSHISNSRMAIEVESDGGDNAPKTITFGSSNSNRLIGCTGTMVFDDGGWQAANPASGQFQFGGVVMGDTSLTSGNSVPPGWL